MSTHIMLTFGTENGRNKTFRIPNVKDDLTGGTVLTAMQFIRNSNAFYTRNGALVESKRAVHFTVGRKPYDIS